MITFVSIMLVLACVIVIAAVLLQPAKSGVTALGGSSQSVFGSTGGTTFLFRVTMWTAAFIMAGCLFLSWYKIHNARQSYIDSAVPGPLPSAPSPSTPDAGASLPPPGSAANGAIPTAPATAPIAPTAPTPPAAQ